MTYLNFLTPLSIVINMQLYENPNRAEYVPQTSDRKLYNKLYMHYFCKQVFVHVPPLIITIVHLDEKGLFELLHL